MFGVCLRSLAVFLVLLSSPGCRTLRQYTGFGVGPGPVAGLTSAAVSRASGGCFAACTPGHRCVEETGLCEPLAEPGSTELEVHFGRDAGL